MELVFSQLWHRLKELDNQVVICQSKAEDAEMKGDTLEEVFWDMESRVYGLRYLAIREELDMSSLDVYRSNL